MSSKKIGSIFLLPLLLILLLGILIFSMPETVQSTVTEQSTMPNTHTTILTTAVPINLPTLAIGSATIDVDTGEEHHNTISLYDIPASRPLNALDLKISYDASLIAPTRCTVGPDGDLGITDCDLTTPGSIHIKAISTRAVAGGGVDIASMSWDILGPSGESTFLTVDELTILDTNNTEINYIVQNQTIHITGGNTGAEPVIVVGKSIFDLALVKSNSNGIVRDGESTHFEIKVCNQGNISASEILIVDYLPDALTLSDDAWTQVGNQAELTIAGPLAPDNCTSVEIKLFANHSLGDDSLETVSNRAEIVRAIDTTGDIRTHDVDSTYDRIAYNDFKIHNGSVIGNEDDYGEATVHIVTSDNHCYYYDALNCDGVFTAVDALLILQKEVGIVPLPISAPGRSDPSTEDRLDEWCNFMGVFPHNDSNVAGDINGNGICDGSDYEDYVYDVNGDYECNSVDALFILQCEVGLSNSHCPQ